MQRGQGCRGRGGVPGLKAKGYELSLEMVKIF